MKKLLVFVISVTFSLASLAQISYREAPKTKEVIPAYDSLENLPKNSFRSICGQKVLILGTKDFYRISEYYEPVRKEEVLKKSYTVISFKRDENNPRQIWMKLALDTDTIYYNITNQNIERPQFLTIGYYEKQKQLRVGKIFKFKLTEKFKELNTGIIKEFSREDNFTCTDITILKEDDKLIPSYIIKNEKGEEIGVPLKNYELSMSMSIYRFEIN